MGVAARRIGGVLESGKGVVHCGVLGSAVVWMDRGVQCQSKRENQSE